MQSDSPFSFSGTSRPPALDPQTAQQLSFQNFLERSQWWSEDTLKQFQFRQLCKLVEFSREHSTFYARQLAGIPTSEEGLHANWQKVPILKRADLHEKADIINTSQVPEEHGPVTTTKTSGSIGMAVEVRKTGLYQFYWQGFNLRDHLWQGRDLSGKLASIRYFADESEQGAAGFTVPDWGASTRKLTQTGPAVGLHILTPIAEQARWIEKQNPQYLLTHPSIMLELAQYFLKNKKKLPGLIEVRTISETLPEELREIVYDAWGVPLVDIYSCIEIGYLALQCPDHQHYHVQSENVLLEILDDQDRPCKPGETGRVVVTSLYNFATPLIRYELGDLAEVGEPCSCGRGLPVIKRIWGRYRNLATLPTGEKRWSVCSLLYFDSPEPFRQVQLIQKSLEEIDVKIAAPGPLKRSTEQLIINYLQEKLGYPFQFSFQYVDEIRRQDNGKFEEFISLLNIS